MREAILDLSDDDLGALGFGDLVSHCRQAGIRDVEMLEDDGYSCVPQVEVDARLDEDLLEDLDCVDDWNFVTETGDGYRYLLHLTTPEFSADVADDHADLVGQCDTSLTERGLLLSLVGSQDAIREMLRNYQDVGVSPDLCKLGEYEGDQAPLDALTDRQQEVLETAFDMGFYDVPRQASTADIAAELDIGPGTLSEHLQRAERNLLSSQLTTSS